MATNSNSISKRGGDSLFDSSRFRGVNQEKGIVIGIVKENSHSVRMGNILVFIPGTGAKGKSAVGDQRAIEDDPAQWRMVRYATPWYSRTEVVNQSNEYTETKNTAGIIYPAPDIGTRVLCFFPEGKNQEGFWFACAPDTYMMQSLPEATRTENFAPSKSTQFQPRGSAPAGEFNDKIQENNTNKLTNFSKPTRPLQQDVFDILRLQGLDQDSVKGGGTSGYMRETPSELIGITSKGRRTDSSGKDISERTDIIDALRSNNEKQGNTGDKINTLKGFHRKKGHSVILDDGDLQGDSQLLRLKSAGGGQFLIHDSEEIVYIINQKGNAWISIDKHGQIDFFSESNISFRAKNLNMHADENFKVHTGKNYEVVSEQEVAVQANNDVSVLSKDALVTIEGKESLNLSSNNTRISSGGVLDVKASGPLNMDGSIIQLAGPANEARKKSPININSVSDVELRDGFYGATGKTNTTVDRFVTHEPYNETGVLSGSTTQERTASGGNNTASKSFANSSLSNGAFPGGVGTKVASALGSFGSDFNLSSGITAPAGKLGSSLTRESENIPGLANTINSVGVSSVSSVLSGETQNLDTVITAATQLGGAKGLTGLANQVGLDPNIMGTVTQTLSVTGADGLQSITKSVPGLSSIGDNGGLVQSVGGNLGVEFPLGNVVKSASAAGGLDLTNSNPGLARIANTGFSGYNNLDNMQILDRVAGQAQSKLLGNPVSSLQNNLPGLGNIDNLVNAGVKQTSSRFNIVDILKTPDFAQGVGKINPAVMRGLASAASSFMGAVDNPGFVDSRTGAVGKYGFSVRELKGSGLVREDTVLNSQLTNPVVWTGKQGINSLESFQRNSSIQDNIFVESTQKTYQDLANNGSVFPTDDDDTIATLINVSKTVGTSNVKNIRSGKPLEPFPVDGTTIVLSTDDVQSKASEMAGFTKSSLNSPVIQNLRKTYDTTAGI